MLLPYASDRPPKNPPIAVVCLVLAHFLVFGLVWLVIAVRGLAAPVVWYANLSIVPAMPHWYSFVTYAFLHDSILHLSANMLFLWVFGSSVEDAIGWRRFLGIYFAAVVATGALQFGMALIIPHADRTAPIIGASGAVSAILGIFAVRFYRSRIRFIGLPFRIPAVVLLALVLFEEMVATVWELVTRAGAAATVAHWAHIGGFALGMAYAQVTRLHRAGRHEYQAADAATELEKGSPLAAARRWETVLRRSPDNPEAEASLAKAWAVAGDREQSLQHYRHAIRALLERGDKNAASKRFVEMRQFYAGAPLPPADLFAVAGALEEAGNYVAAAEAFESVVRLQTAGREAEMSRLRLGVLFLNRLDDPTRGRAHLASFIASYPQSEWRTYAEDMLRRVKSEE